MGLLKEFKDFAIRGNVVDLAVAVIIGAAFGKIVTSFVKDIVMPFIGMIAGVNFSDMKATLKEATFVDGVETYAAITVNYGVFIQTVIDFILVAFAVFMVVKAIISMKKKKEAAPAAPAEDTVLLREIRDAVKK